MNLKRDAISLAAAFVATVIMFTIVYHNESFMVVLRMTASLYWLFTLPGYAIVYVVADKLTVTVRIMIGTVVGMAIVGVLSYYLGLIGLLLDKQVFLLPAVIIVVCAGVKVYLIKRIGKGVPEHQATLVDTSGEDAGR